MNIQRNALLELDGHEAGRVVHVIVDQRTNEVTELVVRSAGRDWQVPIGLAEELEGGRVTLVDGYRVEDVGRLFDEDSYEGVEYESVRDSSPRRATYGGAPVLNAEPDAVHVATPADRVETERLVRSGVHDDDGDAVWDGQQPSITGPDPDGFRLRMETARLRVAEELAHAGTVPVGPQVTDHAFRSITGSEDLPLEAGTPVVTSDGEALGTVGEVRGDLLRVAVPLAPDIWVQLYLIAGEAPGGDLMLSVTKDELEDIRLEPEE
jgi:sporulation protein YlmC with PRC-barrel domain